jgi:hypothetical protein
MSYATASVVFPAVATFTANSDAGTEIRLVGEQVQSLLHDAEFAVSSASLRAALNAYFKAEQLVDTSGNDSTTLQVSTVPGAGDANLGAIATAAQSAVVAAEHTALSGTNTVSYLENEIKEDIQKVFNWDIIADALYGVSLTSTANGTVGDAIKSMLASAAAVEGAPAIQSLFEQVAAQRSVTGDLSGSIANNNPLEFASGDKIGFVVDYDYNDATVVRSATVNFAANADFSSAASGPGLDITGVELPLSKRRILYTITLSE